MRAQSERSSSEAQLKDIMEQACLRSKATSVACETMMNARMHMLHITERLEVAIAGR
jgi:hypothetical protein